MEGITVHNQKKAVSIRYNEEHVAPEISDKAAGLDAEELIRLAQEAGIYIHKDPVLLSYLDSLPEGASIPRELYLIMAILNGINKRSKLFLLLFYIYITK